MQILCLFSNNPMIRSAYDPILRSMNIHLRRGPQDRDCRDETAGDGHGGGEQTHLLVGKQVL